MSRTVGDYRVAHRIGQGSFATVYRAQHATTRADVAIKVIQRDTLNRRLAESLESEIKILKTLRHPNVVRLLDLYKTERSIYLVLEYCAGGDLSKYIRKKKFLPEATARAFMRQIAAALEYCNGLNIIHRDLKPQNLLLSHEGDDATILIADWGFGKFVEPQGMAETLCGSPLYMAPEILGRRRYGANADLWSVGTILWEMLTGAPPYRADNHILLLEAIQKSHPRFPPEIFISPACQHLLECLLRPDPATRITFADFFAHPFLADDQADPAAMIVAAPMPADQSDADKQLVSLAPGASAPVPIAGATPAMPAPLLTGGSPPLSRFSPPNDGLPPRWPVMRQPRTYPFKASPNKPGQLPPHPQQQQQQQQQQQGALPASPRESEDDYVLVGVDSSSESMPPAQITHHNVHQHRRSHSGGSSSSIPNLFLSVGAAAPGTSSSTAAGMGIMTASQHQQQLAAFFRTPVSPDDLVVDQPAAGAPDASTDTAADHEAAIIARVAQCLSVARAGDQLAKAPSTRREALALYVASLDGLYAVLNAARTLATQSPPTARLTEAVADLRTHFQTYLGRMEALRADLAAEPSDFPVCAEKVVYEFALQAARAAAVEEMMGNAADSSVQYADALELVRFLLANPGLDAADRNVLEHYAAAIVKRIRTVAERVM